MTPGSTESERGDLLETRVSDRERASPASESGCEIGDRIGRFVVLSVLGAGAMGIVLAAYDPELDRKAALKLLKHAGKAHESRERLRREAQALARLNHVNVVTVHDVGVHEGRVFVAMEFVRGQTLREWISGDTPRPWPEVLRVFAAAGEGLAAAHEVGLIHRDFKPENVMLGDDGRVRVMDFGLARRGDEQTFDEPGREHPSSRSDSFSLALTKTGTQVGTPAYMAPEQFEGKLAGAHSDQFEFCVALYEALYGRRPFVGDSYQDLARAVLRGELQPPPPTAKVPGWIAKVVTRGLAVDPAQRHPSMRALLDALARDPGQRYRRAGLGGAMLVALASAVWLGGVLQRGEPPTDPKPCANMDVELRGVWDVTRRIEVDEAILATQLSYANQTSQRVTAGLDAYTSAWVAARVEACEATRAGTQSGELLDRKIACLDERLARVDALVAEVAAAEIAAVERATQAVMDLPSLAPCADAEALATGRRPPEDPAVAAQVDALETELHQIRAKISLANYDEAGSMVNALVEAATSLDYEPLLIQAWLEQGVVDDRLGHYEQALATLTRAYDAALGQQMLAEATDAAIELTDVAGQSLKRLPDAERWAAVARALSELLGTDSAWARYLLHVATLQKNLGRYAESLASIDEARVLTERTYGPEHIKVSLVLAQAGAVSLNAGEFERARELLEQALAILEPALGSAHPNVANTLANLGIVAFRTGDYVQAREKLEQARVIFERAMGPESFQVSRTLDSLGSAALLQGDYAQARAYYEQAQVLLVELVGPDHPQMAALIANLGEVARNEGAFERGLEQQLRAREIIAASVGLEHPSLILVQTEIGKDLLGLGRPAEAIPELERALALYDSFGGDPLALPDIRFTLARALWDAGTREQRTRAHALALLAVTSYAGAGAAKRLAGVEAWLAERDSPTAEVARR
ncbi:serine/threonine-protein kinase [Enhygromyxa salina]|uniref:Serine/threonine-protein kinase PrkC n=1 Tax=Enhygromyxa salina TaxID=215803 RepID=A0A2S9YVV4_9BACT|nr:serine/threonine-protein kinase [Enhygromyxa salina]PRQ09227.1 Serine/threonine-protein kinase PrkC [Enhygromyxa salina]